VNEGALCSRMPPRCVSSRATNERLSLRNSIEHTVSSSSSSRGGRVTGTGFGSFAGGAFLGFGRATALRARVFGLAAFRGLGRAAFRAGFFGFRATGPVSAEGIKAFRSRDGVGSPKEERDG